MSLNNQFKVKNDLNVLGKILSGGKDLSDIFSQATANFTVESVNDSTTFQVSGSESFKIDGRTGIFVTASNTTDTLVISGVDATGDRKGVASFSTTNFAINDGAVTIKTGGVDNSNLAANSVTKGKIDASAIVKGIGALTFTTSDGFSVNVDDSTVEVNGGTNNLQIKDSGVTGAKLNSNVVDDTTLQYAGSQLKIKDTGVTGAKLNTNVADNSTIELNANTLRVKDSGITGVKLNTNVVDNSTIELHSNALRVKDAGITHEKLAANSVTKAKIDPSSIVYPDGAISFTVANGLSANVDNSTIEITTNNLNVKDSGITNAKLAANSVSKSKVDASNILKASGALNFTTVDGFGVNTDNTTIEIASNNLQIKDGGVSNAKLAVDSVSKSKINASSILKSTNSGLTFTTGDGFSVNVDTISIELNSNNLSIADGGVSTPKLAASSVNKYKIDENTIVYPFGAISFTSLSGISANVDNDTIEVFSNRLRVKAGGIANANLANDGIYFGNGTSSAKTALGSTFYVKGTPNEVVSTFNLGSPNDITLSLPSTLNVPGSLTVANGTTTVEDLLVNKTLVVAGSATFANTLVTTSSALSVINTGPTPALYVKNSNTEYDIATFVDGDGTEVLHVGNSLIDTRGCVGINVGTYTNGNVQPDLVGLTVNGQISASETITVLGHYSSYQWGHTYTTVAPNSANWNTAYTAVNNNATLWDSTYSTYKANSGTYLVTGTDVSVTGLTVTNNTYSTLRKVYSNSTTSNNNILHVNTLSVGTVSAVKYIAMIKNNTTGRKASAEIFALVDQGSWVGTVYAILDPSLIIDDIDITTPAGFLRLSFTFTSNANFTATVLADSLNGL